MGSFFAGPSHEAPAERVAAKDRDPEADLERALPN